MRARRRRCPVGLVERLEDRALLAGDLAVTFESGVLTIIGDGEDNAAEFSAEGGVASQLIPLQGTTINGSSAPFSIVTSVDSLIAELGGGDDSLLVRNYFSFNNLEVELAEGEDELVISNVVTATLSLRGGADDDTFQITDITGSSMAIDCGDGDDFVGMVSVSRLMPTTLIGSEGNDQFHIYGCSFVGLGMSGGSGNDVVSLVNSLASGDTFIDVGAGNDNMGIAETAFAGELDIIMSPGKDKVMITSSSGPSLTINTISPLAPTPRGAVKGSNGTTIVLTYAIFTTKNTNPVTPDTETPTTKKHVQKIYKKVFKSSLAKEIAQGYGQSSQPWYSPLA